MEKWEYMVWAIGYAGTGSDMKEGWQGGVVKWLNGKLVSDWKQGLRLPEALNQAGAQGWELVSTNYFTQSEMAQLSDPVFIFKRLLPQ